MELPDYLPISFLNQLTYCERRFWYMFVEGEMEENVYVLEGTLQHQRVHTPTRATPEGGEAKPAAGHSVRRRVYIYSDRLRLAGFSDLIEQRGEQLVPVEYKHGKLGKWANDEIQLCAQALCLEERTDQRIPFGEIFYFGGRHRVQVDFTPALRQQTEAAVWRAFALLAAGEIPPPTTVVARCRDCSLQPVCLPREVARLRGSPFILQPLSNSEVA